jgi:hypothetical protein
MSTRHNKNEVCTSTMWNVITSINVFKFTVSMKEISSISNLKRMILSLFNNNDDLLIRRRIVNCLISSEKKFVAWWSINIFLNSRSSYLDAIKTMWIYDIEIIKTIVLFFEMSLCLNVLSANMLMIVMNVSMSFIDSTKMRNVSNSLLISMTNSSIEIFFCETSSMINFSKYWAMNFRTRQYIAQNDVHTLSVFCMSNYDW